MKKTVYIRVSTEAQSYDRQMYEIKNYFDSMGMSMEGVDVIQEKITSYTKFTERAIYPVLNNAQEGDIIYVCQLDRLGRTVEDVISLVKFADNKGVIIIGTKDRQQITYKNSYGKMMLTLFAMVAEMERELRAERCQSGISAAREELKKNGYRVSRISGKVQTHWGNKKGTEESKRIMENARIYENKRRADEAIAWRESSPAYKWVMDKVREGWERKKIIEEFNKLHEIQPDVFCTRTGKKLTPVQICKWVKEAGI